jgi:hypothetical protein
VSAGSAVQSVIRRAVADRIRDGRFTRVVVKGVSKIESGVLSGVSTG